MAKKKSNIVLIGGAVLLVILLAFFWPKVSQSYDDSFTAEIAGKSFYKNMQCSCLGFEAWEGNCKSCTQKTDCYGLVTSCQYKCKKKLDGVWQFVNCNSEIPLEIQIPTTKEACESSGGSWGPIGLSETLACVMPTADGGQECSDSSECQGACVAELTQDEYATLGKGTPIYKKGKCTFSTSPVGCRAYVINGKVDSMLCVD
jgi:hypothetical protein